MKKFLSFMAMAAIFSGCANYADLYNKNQNPKEYLESSGEISTLSIKRFANSQNVGIIGEVYKHENGKRVFLGNLIELAPNGELAVILDENQNSAKSIMQKNLKTSKKLKFYPLGGGIIESISYDSGNLGLCEAFAKAKPITAKSATNYYYDENKSEKFFATLAEIEIYGTKKHKVKNLEYKFLPNSVNSERKAKFEKNMIEQDFEKQRRILENIICVEY